MDGERKLLVCRINLSETSVLSVDIMLLGNHQESECVAFLVYGLYLILYLTVFCHSTCVSTLCDVQFFWIDIKDQRNNGHH